MTVSVIIVNFNGGTYTEQCLRSLQQHWPSSIHDVIVVDNASTDGSPDRIKELFPSITLLRMPQNRGFGAANNAGAKAAGGDFLFFLNNDTVITQDPVTPLMELLQHDPQCGIAAPLLYNMDGSYQVSFGEFPSPAAEARMRRISKDAAQQHLMEPRGTDKSVRDWVSGAAFMMRASDFSSIGGFDERFFMYFEDVDLCRRVRNRGMQCLLVPAARLIHLGGKSYGKKDDRIALTYRRSQLRYYDLHTPLHHRLMLRSYLCLKFLPLLFRRNERSLAAAVLSAVLRSRGGT